MRIYESLLYCNIRALASARGSVATRRVAKGPKGPRTKGTATRGPEGPESGQNMRVRGPEGPEDEQSPVPVLALASATICFSRFSQKSRFSWHYLGPLMTAKMHENFSRVLYLQYLLSLVCRSLELETYSRFSHEQLFVEESRESFVQRVIKVGYKVEW